MNVKENYNKRMIKMEKKLSRDKLWEYLYKQRFTSKIEGYRTYQIRLQRQLQNQELLVSFSSGSRFICFPIDDLDTVIMELIELRTKIRKLSF